MAPEILFACRIDDVVPPRSLATFQREGEGFGRGHSRAVEHSAVLGQVLRLPAAAYIDGDRAPLLRRRTITEIDLQQFLSIDAQDVTAFREAPQVKRTGCCLGWKRTLPQQLRSDWLNHLEGAT